MFKKLAVFSLLSFISLAKANQDLSNMREELLKQQLDLSDLGQQIEDRELMLENMTKAIAAAFDSLTEQRRNELMREIAGFIDRFNHASVTGPITNFLMYEFFNDPAENCDKLMRAKSLLVRKLVEREILKQLVYRYAQQLEVITTMNLELIAYEKN